MPSLLWCNIVILCISRKEAEYYGLKFKIGIVFSVAEF